MPPELNDFKIAVLQHAKVVEARAPRIETEAGTNTSLVQPFLRLLGYDAANPDEVSPEHHADFSEKYQNKVDYAILHKSLPVIAIESKRVGSQMKDDRGQLRSYFNACPSVKLGILTDGVRFEFFADSDKPNMMDESSFLKIDFIELARDGAVSDHALSGLAAVRNGSFNPENVGAEAKQKLLFESILTILKEMKNEPSDEFIRFLLRQSDVGNKIGNLTQRIVDSNREMIKSAIDAFVAQEALARLGYEPKDVVKTPPESSAINTAPAASTPIDNLLPTENENKILLYIKNRLFFLITDDRHFDEVGKIAFKKSKTSFRIYYSRPNSGSIIDYWEQKDGKAYVAFPSQGVTQMQYAPSRDFDDRLLKAFVGRIKGEVPPSMEPTVSLRSIQGGQAD